MKQHITEDQWKELDAKGQLVIAKMFPDGIEDPEFFVDNPSVYIPVSIGEMMEILAEEDFTITRGSTTGIFWYYISKVLLQAGIQFASDDELADLLWSQVKRKVGNL